MLLARRPNLATAACGLGWTLLLMLATARAQEAEPVSLPAAATVVVRPAADRGSPPGDPEATPSGSVAPAAPALPSSSASAPPAPAASAPLPAQSSSSPPPMSPAPGNDDNLAAGQPAESAPAQDAVPSASTLPPPSPGLSPAGAGPMEAPPVASVIETPELREDLWARVRRHYGIEDLDDDRVRRWEQFYLSRPDYLGRMFERGGLYLFHIVEETVRRGLPTELALLPFIESAFNPLALSSAKASGIWQFMPATGRHFDLRQNLFRDDRRSVLDSTRAALDYLQQLHAMFDDWHLALAAYNWGQGNVARAQASNRKRGRGTTYLELRMPDETRNYVPKLQAIANLVEHPERYGLTLPPLENHPYFLSVEVDRDIDVERVALLAGVSVEHFRALNPQHNKPVILAAGTPQLLLPFDNARRFRVELDRHQGPLASWTAWVAPRTLNVRDAARMTGMDEGELRALNRIPSGMVIKAGSTLLVPRAASATRDVPGHVAETAVIALASERPAPRQRIVRAGPRGESVAALARRYRVSAAQLAAWNNVPVEGRLRPGQRVVLQGGSVASKSAPQVRAQPPAVSRQAARRSAASKHERGRAQARPAVRELARGG